MRIPYNVDIPFPDSLIDDVGLFFGIGVVGGSTFHFIKGIYNSPAGIRLSGGARAIRMNTPRVGGRFAVWGGVQSTLWSAMMYARQKEDPWNCILSTTATMGLLAMPRGLGVSARCAAVGGVLTTLLQGSFIVLCKVSNELGKMKYGE